MMMIVMVYSKWAQNTKVKLVVLVAGRRKRRLDLDAHCEIVFYPWRHRGHELEKIVVSPVFRSWR